MRQKQTHNTRATKSSTFWWNNDRDSRYNFIILGYLLLLQLNRSLNNICAHIKSFSFPFVAFLSSPRPSPTPHTLFLNLPFCVCPPPSRAPAGQRAEVLWNSCISSLICSFPSQQRGKYMPTQLASCLTAPEKAHSQSSTAIPPAFTEGGAPKPRL